MREQERRRLDAAGRCRCGPPAGRPWRGGRSGSGSGRRSSAACRARMPQWRPRVSRAVGTRWFRDAGGMRPITQAPVSGRYLSFAEREEIAILRAGGCGVREIARRAAGRLRRSRGSCGGMPRPAAGAWSTGPRRPSGTPTAFQIVLCDDLLDMIQVPPIRGDGLSHYGIFHPTAGAWRPNTPVPRAVPELHGHVSAVDRCFSSNEAKNWRTRSRLASPSISSLAPKR